jgi:hypothetical protein
VIKMVSTDRVRIEVDHADQLLTATGLKSPVSGFVSNVHRIKQHTK